MRVLLMFRGAPGCGKSTFIEEHGLKPYTLSADDIRLLCQSPQQDIWGIDQISMNNENTTWKVLFNLLETRMQNGEFTVIDATNSKTIEMNRYKDMCDTYRYRMYIIDFTKLPIEECKRRNKTRPSIKQVPEEVIDKMYARFKTQKIPSGIKAVKPEDLDSIFMKKFDMSSYDKIVHIGDIHGCYEPLKEYFKDGLEENTMYIFTGDYLDRGIQNVDTIKFLMKLSENKNVLLLTGNHEKNLWAWSNTGYGVSKEFEFKTRPQLVEAGIDPKDVRCFCRKLGQMAWYQFDDKEIYVTHAGIAMPLDNMTLMATVQMVKGVGDYDDYGTVADTWMDNTDSNMYQIFGHRNSKDEPINMRPRVFNLEGNVEYGGYLRIVELSHDKGFEFKYIKNDVFKLPEEVTAVNETKTEDKLTSIEEMVLKLRQSRLVQEKKFDNNISSFNFTSRAFRDKAWDEQTQKARGLYINTDKMKIVARGYDKFFNINEKPETRFEMLKYSLTFPVTAYVKENGYLGLISYNEETDDLFITTKSDPTGEYAVWLANSFYANVPKDKVEDIKDYCKVNNVTLVFEHVDMNHDPHIIEYKESDNLFLLDAIYNTVDYDHIPYEELVELGKEFNLKVKTKAKVLETWDEFYDWYNEVNAEDYLYEGRHIEGFVIEDAKKFMTKIKLYYYTFWKHMRSVAHVTLKHGSLKSTGELTCELDNLFYGFLRDLYNSKETKEERETITRDIITLRKMFYETQGDK